MKDVIIKQSSCYRSALLFDLF